LEEKEEAWIGSNRILLQDMVVSFKGKESIMIAHNLEEALMSLRRILSHYQFRRNNYD
jgi:hypothetical protein